MKKVIKLLFIFMCVVFISGCAGTKVTKCTLKSDQSASGYTLDSTYDIYSKDDVVTKVVTKEVVNSENTTIIAYFEKTLKDQYENANKKYGGYTVDVKKEDKKVISSVTIDYNKVDLASYVKDNTAMKSYVNKDNKLTLKGAKSLYESLGASCE